MSLLPGKQNFLFPIYLDDFATFLAMCDKKLEGPQKVQLWSLPTRCKNIFMKNTQLKWKLFLLDLQFSSLKLALETYYTDQHLGFDQLGALHDLINAAFF